MLPDELRKIEEKEIGNDEILERS
jgi:hypothetical protein